MATATTRYPSLQTWAWMHSLTSCTAWTWDVTGQGPPTAHHILLLPLLRRPAMFAAGSRGALHSCSAARSARCVATAMPTSGAPRRRAPWTFGATYICHAFLRVRFRRPYQSNGWEHSLWYALQTASCVPCLLMWSSQALRGASASAEVYHWAHQREKHYAHSSSSYCRRACCRRAYRRQPCRLRTFRCGARDPCRTLQRAAQQLRRSLWLLRPLSHGLHCCLRSRGCPPLTAVSPCRRWLTGCAHGLMQLPRRRTLLSAHHQLVIGRTHQLRSEAAPGRQFGCVMALACRWIFRHCRGTSGGLAWLCRTPSMNGT